MMNGAVQIGSVARRAAVAAVITGGLVASGAGAAMAQSWPTQDDLTPAQQQAIAAWEAPQEVARADRKSDLSRTTADSGTNVITLYRGSALLWAQERVDFGYGGGGVRWSAGSQTSGAILPNNVTQNGTAAYLQTPTLHAWRGSYTIGAGAPTPWGYVNVYQATDVGRTLVKNIGSVAWWE